MTMLSLSSSFIFASALLFQVSTALQCGEILTTPCLGQTDIRYDPKSSNNAVDQAEVWGKFDGYFIGEGKFQFLFPGSEELSSAYDLKLFVNNTVKGSRMMAHRIELTSLNDIFFTDSFATTSYEKDGTMSFISKDPNRKLGKDLFRAYDVDENSAFFTFKAATGDVGSESWYSLDSDANTARILSDQFQSINGSLILSKTYHAFETRVTEQEWIDAVNAAYKASGLSTKKQVPVPMVGNCLEKVCPTEEDWCSQDPECSTSPFQEPKASLKAGALSGFIIAGIVILLALCFAVHRWLSSRQIKRYKTIFAKRIAETISVNKSFRSMEPEELAEEFKKVDLQTEDGLITKDDLWEFISSGKAGEISESDFNALFAAIDSDGDGQVDFLAFCAFMGQCHDEYKQARADQTHLADISERRLEVANLTARASFRRISSYVDQEDGVEIHEKQVEHAIY